MKNKDARNILCAHVMVACDKANFDKATKNMVEEALDMAIQALDSWDKYSGKLWDQAYDRGVKDGILFTIDKECKDCVSREEVMKLLEKEDWADTVEGVINLPPVQPPGKELYDCFKVGAAIQNIVSRVDKETLEQIKEYLDEIKTIVRGESE